ncbi:hypothetical protein [Holdemania massiliensis]|uniref:hypothetical protein n=1 Tax=Holdemania massiliensis TaxID=1468449 RepID=UPI001F05D01C|nr:hypothetical protein [Holdemania massiliensis]MCH1939533.1 hypothetical protein [Holdemania massiliensis]
MKFTFKLFLLVFLLLIVGCHNSTISEPTSSPQETKEARVNPSNTEPEYFPFTDIKNAVSHTGFLDKNKVFDTYTLNKYYHEFANATCQLVESSDSIFFTDSKTLYQISKDHFKISSLITGNNIGRLYLYDNRIYFTDYTDNYLTANLYSYDLISHDQALLLEDVSGCMLGKKNLLYLTTGSSNDSNRYENNYFAILNLSNGELNVTELNLMPCGLFEYNNYLYYYEISDLLVRRINLDTLTIETIDKINIYVNDYLRGLNDYLYFYSPLSESICRIQLSSFQVEIITPINSKVIFRELCVTEGHVIYLTEDPDFNIPYLNIWSENNELTTIELPKGQVFIENILFNQVYFSVNLESLYMYDLTNQTIIQVI